MAITGMSSGLGKIRPIMGSIQSVPIPVKPAPQPAADPRNRTQPRIVLPPPLANASINAGELHDHDQHGPDGAESDRRDACVDDPHPRRCIAVGRFFGISDGIRLDFHPGQTCSGQPNRP